jgi:hypothetical protein
MKNLPLFPLTIGHPLKPFCPQMVLRNCTAHARNRNTMAEQIPFSLALLVILGIIVFLGLVELAVFYFVSTRTKDRFLRAAAPVAVILLGVSSQMDFIAGSVLATCALVTAPVAAFIPTVLFPGFAGQKTGIKRIVVCYLIVALLAADFAFYSVMSGLSMVPGMHSLTPVSNGVGFLAALAVDLLLAAGVYKGMERAGVLREG